MKKTAPRKRKFKKKYKVLLVFILTISAFLLWSRFISTSGIKINEYKIENVNLASGFHGLKIVHFSDVHYGRTINEKELKKIVHNINLLNPDIVVFTGDLIDRDSKLTEEMKLAIIDNLINIKSLYGNYAISGNHDFYFNDYNEILEKGNFINLNNTYDIIYNEYYEPLFIGGIESEIKGNPDITPVVSYFEPDESDGKVAIDPIYKILIMHTPDTFDQINSYDFDLVLAGHSHNGQVRLPFAGPIITPVGAKKYYEHYYKIESTDFFISGGLGCSVLNFRFFNKPSMNFYRITKK